MDRCFERVFDLVRQIPPGRVMSYGSVGKCVGFGPRQVGRIMARATPDVPWWRVVGHDGRFPLAKENPLGAMHQDLRLAEEGTPFISEARVNMREAAWWPEDEPPWQASTID